MKPQVRIRPGIPRMASATDFAETSVRSGIGIVVAPIRGDVFAVEGILRATMDCRRGASALRKR